MRPRVPDGKIAVAPSKFQVGNSKQALIPHEPESRPMPTRKIPPEALTYYVGLGAGRSYQKVADKYGVSKRAVTKLAAKERWQEKVAEIEHQARESAEEKAKSEIEAAYAQQIVGVKLLFRRGVEALKTMAIDNPADATRAIQVACREWRAAMGEPTDRTAIEIDEKIRREYERWMTVAEPEPPSPAVQDDDDGEAARRGGTA